MKSLSRTYAITCLLFLAVLAVSPLKNYFREWRAVQKDYNRMAATLPQRVRPAPMALQQIWVRDLNRIDRCTSCHLGVADQKLAAAPQPFQTHPKVAHDVENFGCTICHGGQGLATEYADAHLPTTFWDEPVLPNRYLESSCGVCHKGASHTATAVLNRGRELIQKFNCVACHKLSGVEKNFVPALDGIGSKVNRSWLVRWLKNPREFRPKTLMPDFFLADEEANLLADFLMSFKAFPEEMKLDSLPAIYHEKKADESFVNQGQTLFRLARCISCHAVEGRGGKQAPDLAKIASKANATWIYNYLKNPQRLQKHIEMPQYGFTDEQLAAVTAYIESEFVDWDAPEDTSGVHEPAPNFYARGLQLFNQYNCGGCHALPSARVVENLGPELTNIGGKKLYEIDFGNAEIPRTLHDFIYTKLKTPRRFRETLRMPKYAFTEDELQAVTTALLAQREVALPSSYLVPEKSAGRYEPQGAVGEIIRKYACLGCHRINGRGEDIAPDLSVVGSQLQPQWTERYFEVPYSLRPIVEERMPTLFIAKPEVKTLLDYFYSVLLDDSLAVPNGVFDFSPTTLEKGKALFWEKYGCQSCHQIDGQGGYVGPPLDQSGERLQSAWIYRWLLDPQKYKPQTLEPRSGMSDDEAKAVTAYLMSLKGEAGQ